MTQSPLMPESGQLLPLAPAATAIFIAVCALSGCAHNSDGITDLKRVTVPGTEGATPKPRLDILWRVPVVPYTPWVWKPLQYSQPQVSPEGDMIVVGTSTGDLVALNTLDGALLWRSDTGSRIDAQPVFHDDLVIVGNDDGELVAVSRGSGERRWSYDTRAEIDGAATVAQGRVFFLNSADELFALDVTTGKYLWSYGRELPDYFTLGNASQPTVHKDSVIAGFADGFLAAIQIDSGEEIWEADLRSGEEDFTDVDGKPAVAGGWVYAASHAGGLFGLDVATGARKWRLDVTGASTVVVRGGAIYTTTAGRYVMAVDRKNGQVLWQYRHRENIPTTPTTLANYLFYGGTESGFYITDRTSGYPLLHFDPDSGFNTPATFFGSKAYAFSNRGFLYGFEVVTY